MLDRQRSLLGAAADFVRLDEGGGSVCAGGRRQKEREEGEEEEEEEEEEDEGREVVTLRRVGMEWNTILYLCYLIRIIFAFSQTVNNNNGQEIII